MGCDIHIYAEKRGATGQWEYLPNLTPFIERSYRTFGFLANVRNYSDVIPISHPRGLPQDVSPDVDIAYQDWESDAHSKSWLSVVELLAFNYDDLCEDRRVTRQVGPNSFDGACTCESGEGRMQTYRDFLGHWFFDDLKALQDAGAERIVFWFDN